MTEGHADALVLIREERRRTAAIRRNGQIASENFVHHLQSLRHKGVLFNKYPRKVIRSTLWGLWA